MNSSLDKRVLGIAGMLLLPAASLVACQDSCVARGTRVRTKSGSRAVEDLVVGDEVLAFDIAGFVSVERRLTAVVVGSHREIFEIHAGGAVVRATAVHPFWVPEKRAWVRADALEVGDVLVVLDGERPVPGAITRIDVAVRDEPIEVFDLTVAGPEHTFFANDVLVHNKEPLPQCPIDPVTSQCAEDASTGDGGSDTSAPDGG